MKISRFRYLIQIIFFIFFIYGAYLGLRVINFLPVWRCPNQVSHSQGCYLLPLQRLQQSINVPTTDTRGIPFAGYVIFKGWGTYILFFMTLIIFSIIFNKLWCGWLCPFGTFQDTVTFIREKIGFKCLHLTEAIKHKLKPIKYVLLFLFLFLPFISGIGLPSEPPIFCKICPVKSFLSIFDGNFLNLAVRISTNTLFSIITCIFAGVIFSAMIFINRFFCFFCPVAAFINIFSRFSFLRLKKNASKCNFCGNCWMNCPMDIKEICIEKNKNDIQKENCILCLRCIENCPQDAVLFIKVFKKIFFSSSQKYFVRYFKDEKQ